MFLCKTCVGQEGERIVEPPSIKDNHQFEQPLISSNGEQSQNIIMLKRSLYDKYIQKCQTAPFTDPEFPPKNDSLQFEVPGRKIVWRRISEIVSNCILFRGGIQQTDVHQGNAGDKYFLPAISALARFPNRIKTVFHFTTALHKACIYRLIVKVSGEIQEIVIDDYVPVYSDSGRPVFCKSNGEEVWVMLIEKAWAKLKGSYGAILKGCPHEVLSTFCLGPCRSYDLTTRAKESFSHIWEDLKQAYCRHFTVCATSNSAPRQPLLEHSSVYAILGVSEQKNGSQIHQNIRLKRFFNPVNLYGSMVKLNPGFERSTMKHRESSRLQETQKKNFTPTLSELQQSANPGLERSMIPPRESLETQKNDFTLTLSEFQQSFARIDISHDNGSFNSEFRTIQVESMEPTVLEFDVEDDHQAYLTIHKPHSLSSYSKCGHIRLILASKLEQDSYEFEQAKHETTFPDCAIYLRVFRRGRHVLLITANFPEEHQKVALTLTYSWKSPLSNVKQAVIRQLSSYKISISTFLEQVFLTHSHRTKESDIWGSPKEDDWIRSVNRFEEFGFGYVACSVSFGAAYHLGVTLDYDQIQENGLRLLGEWNLKQSIRPGEKRVFIFQLTGDELETDFPPKGFSVSKII